MLLVFENMNWFLCLSGLKLFAQYAGNCVFLVLLLGLNFPRVVPADCPVGDAFTKSKMHQSANLLDSPPLLYVSSDHIFMEKSGLYFKRH